MFSLNLFRKDSNTVILQSARFGQEVLLDISKEHHKNYAEKFNMDYWCFTNLKTKSNGHWDKILMIRRALELNYNFIIWLDSDALIANATIDLRTALSEDKYLGLVPYKQEQEIQYNNGVMYIRNSKEIKKYFEYLWKSPNKICDETSMNRTLDPKYMYLVQVLEDKWNSFSPVAEDSIVAAWHSRRLEDKIKYMKDFLAL